MSGKTKRAAKTKKQHPVLSPYWRKVYEQAAKQNRKMGRDLRASSLGEQKAMHRLEVRLGPKGPSLIPGQKKPSVGEMKERQAFHRVSRMSRFSPVKVKQ